MAEPGPYGAVMSQRGAMTVAAGLGFLAVALGAFGAHGLEKILEANDRVDTWETAVLYHFVHTLALLALAVRGPVPRLVGWSFVIGIAIFSGSLYILSLTGLTWLGVITPLGGVGFLVGWAALAVTGGGAGKEAKA